MTTAAETHPRPWIERYPEGITAEILTDNVKQYGHKNAQYIGDIELAAEKVIPFLRENDLVITLGAGSIRLLSEEILEKLKASERAAAGTRQSSIGGQPPESAPVVEN